MQTPSRVIAVVDDDPSVLRALARLLSSRSYTARIFSSAMQFIGSLSEGLPDCLIADLQMPEMTGLELQEALVSKGIRIPTIIITAHDRSDMRDRCKSAGAIAYLAKPIQDVLLFAAIEAAAEAAKN